MNSNIKVAMLTPASSSGAGVYFATHGLVESLTEFQPVDVEIFSGMRSIDAACESDWKGASVNILKAYGASNFLWTPGLGSSVLKSEPDIIHLHGLWTFQSYAALKLMNIPKIISPHGMLDEWAIKNSPLKKKVAGHLYELKNLKSAHCIHALNENEFDSIRGFGLKNPVAIIPNGVDFQSEMPRDSNNAYWSDVVPKGSKVLLFLGRIHEKKGIESLLHSWKIFLEKIQNNNPHQRWSLVIAGSGQEKYVDKVKRMQLELGIDNTSFFIGPVLGKDKESVFLNSDAFILPSYSEGLPMAALEACSFKLPVLLTDECHLNDVIECGAGIRIKSHKDFSDSLVELAEKNDIEFCKMGNSGFEMVRERYGWQHISTSYVEVYSWLLNQAPRPEFVITN